MVGLVYYVVLLVECKVGQHVYKEMDQPALLAFKDRVTLKGYLVCSSLLDFQILGQQLVLYSTDFDFLNFFLVNLLSIFRLTKLIYGRKLYRSIY